jgi:DNA-binding transcriptional ArsR family regulator
MSKIELLLHPIRFRIIMALSGKRLTPGQIAEDLPDVSQTTLYRQINLLVDGGILSVVDERPIRGTLEKMYEVVEGTTRLNRDEIRSVSHDDHLRYFMVFISTLLQDFSSYIEKRRDEEIPAIDNIYSTAALYLTDEEYRALTEQVRNLVIPYTTSSGERKRYNFAFVSIPED